jgi:hypothetical protein
MISRIVAEIPMNAFDSAKLRDHGQLLSCFAEKFTALGARPSPRTLREGGASSTTTPHAIPARLHYNHSRGILL